MIAFCQIINEIKAANNMSVIEYYKNIKETKKEATKLSELVKDLDLDEK